MKKTYKVTVTNETFITVDADNDPPTDELLDKTEHESAQGPTGAITYPEIEGDAETDE